MSPDTDLDHVLSCMLLAMATATNADMHTLGCTLHACAQAPQLSDSTRATLRRLASKPMACATVAQIAARPS